jgi:hypothetical protein
MEPLLHSLYFIYLHQRHLFVQIIPHQEKDQRTPVVSHPNFVCQVSQWLGIQCWGGADPEKSQRLVVDWEELDLVDHWCGRKQVPATISENRWRSSIPQCTRFQTEVADSNGSRRGRTFLVTATGSLIENFAVCTSLFLGFQSDFNMFPSFRTSRSLYTLEIIGGM